MLTARFARGAEIAEKMYFSFAAERTANENQSAAGSPTLAKTCPYSLFARSSHKWTPEDPRVGAIFFFSALSAEKKIYFLCDLCVFSEAPQGRDKRAVKNMLPTLAQRNEPQVTFKWARSTTH